MLASGTAGRRAWTPSSAKHVQFKQSGDGCKTSLCTRRNVTLGLFRLFGVLREGGFKIENPCSFDTMSGDIQYCPPDDIQN